MRKRIFTESVFYTMEIVDFINPLVFWMNYLYNRVWLIVS